MNPLTQTHFEIGGTYKMHDGDVPVTVVGLQVDTSGDLKVRYTVPEHKDYPHFAWPTSLWPRLDTPATKAKTALTYKPTILIDMDGPLADFDAYFMERSRQHFGPNVFDFDRTGHVGQKAPTPQRFLTDNMEPGPASAMREIINSTRWFRNLPMTPGATAGMRTLEAMVLADYIDAYICTKPLEANPWCRDDKADWVKRHLGTFWENRLIIAPNKAMVRGDILLDDAIKPEWVDHESPSWRPVVFDTPFNQPGTKHGRNWPRFTWGDSIYTLLAQGTN